MTPCRVWHVVIPREFRYPLSPGVPGFSLCENLDACISFAPISSVTASVHKRPTYAGYFSGCGSESASRSSGHFETYVA